MKKVIFLILTTIFTIQLAYGDPVNPAPFEYTQPDGTKVTLRCRGDEYSSWIETTDQTVVVMNENGWAEYATIKNNELTGSGIKVRNTPNVKRALAASGIPGRTEIMALLAKERDALIAYLDSAAEAEKYAEDEDDEVSRPSAPMKRKAAAAKAPATPLAQVRKQRVLCILMQFPDKPFQKTKQDFENFWNGENYNGQTMQRSVSDFYKENSYGYVQEVKATVVGPFTAKKKYAQYKGKNKQERYDKAKELMKEAVNAAIKSGVNLGEFDKNGNDTVDCVHIVFAGTEFSDAAKQGLFDPHHNYAKVTKNKIKTWDYIITPEVVSGYMGDEIAPIGSVCHEYGHVLGAPDFYDNNGKYPGTGHWDVMAAGSNNNFGRTPAHHNPYTKAYIFKWVTPETINPSVINKLYTVTPSVTTKCFYRINGNESDFFLIENKLVNPKAPGQDHSFNAETPAYGYNGHECGLLIYHIASTSIMTTYTMLHRANDMYPQGCYIVNANSTYPYPNESPASYGTNDAEWPYPLNGKRFFTSNSTPSSTSMLMHKPTGVDICFIQNDANHYNVKFVVNPQIEGNNILTDQGEYKVSNIPDDATIKWTYTYNSGNSYLASAQQLVYSAVKFVNGSNASSVLVERGQFPALYIDSISARDGIEGVLNGGLRRVAAEAKLPADTRWVYYTGTVTLKATITCGGYSYVIAKDITLSGTPKFAAPAQARTPYIGSEEDDEQQPNDETSSYRLVYENPVITNSAFVRVEKLENGEYVPYQGNYTLSLIGDRTSLIQQHAQGISTCSIDCGDLPMGVYQLVLHIDGQVAATSKLLKLY